MPDQVGQELPDLRAVRTAAVKCVSALLGEDPERFWNGDDWSVDVRDAQDTALFTLHFIVNTTPAGATLKRRDCDKA